MDKKWFLIYTHILSEPNGLGAERKTALSLLLLEATTEKEAMIEAQKKWAAITWGELKRIRVNPYITQLANITSLFN